MKKRINIIVILSIVGLVFVTGVKAALSIVASQVSYDGTTIQKRLDEILNSYANYECPTNALCSKVKVGDYVSMTPTQTSYTILPSATGYASNQTINPSELNLWRVIKINGDGSIDMISNYVSSNSVYFRGKTGYLNYIGTLNAIADQYSNSSYTQSTRYPGYYGQTATINDTSKFVYPAYWSTTPSVTEEDEKLGGGDSLNHGEFTFINLNAGNEATTPSGVATGYWVASRTYWHTSDTWFFWAARVVHDNGSIYYSDYLYSYYEGSWIDTSRGYSVRPIVTLRPEVNTNTGSGTSSSPWVLS